MLTSQRSIHAALAEVLGLAISIATTCTMASAQSPDISSREVREFEILVNGSPAGTTTTTIAPTDNTHISATTDADVKLNYLVYSYHYEFHGHEVWIGNQPLVIANRALDGGKQLVMRARSDAHGSLIEANDKQSSAAGVISLTTNYWHAPAGKKGDTIALLDADQGTLYSVRIDNIAVDQLAVCGQPTKCRHYHLSGDVTADLWFDAADRLVRQQSTEDGRRVELRLTRMTFSDGSETRR